MIKVRSIRNIGVVLGGLVLGAVGPFVVRLVAEPPSTIELPIDPLDMCTSTQCIVTYGYSFVIQGAYYTYDTCNYATYMCVYIWQA